MTELLSGQFRVFDNGEPADVERLHRWGELVMEALLELETERDDMSDPATATNAETGVIDIEMVIEACNHSAAVLAFDITVKNAFLKASKRLGGGEEGAVVSTETAKCEKCQDSGWIDCNTPYCDDPTHGGYCDCLAGQELAREVDAGEP